MHCTSGLVHAAMHRPSIASHTGVAPEHRTPHPPQLLVLDKSDSQPFAMTPSQSAKPGKHVYEQSPPLHVGRVFGLAGHGAHPPQWPGSTLIDASQPFVALLSQSAKPATHEPEHEPAAHARVQFGRSAQSVPHPPQLSGSARVSTHEPEHIVVPIEHIDVHTAGLRVPSHIKPAAHTLRQLPQLLVVVTDVSQPLLGSLSQSR